MAQRYRVKKTMVYIIRDDAIITLYRGQVWELVGDISGRAHISRGNVSLFISKDGLNKKFIEVKK